MANTLDSGYKAETGAAETENRNRANHRPNLTEKSDEFSSYGKTARQTKTGPGSSAHRNVSGGFLVLPDWLARLKTV
jgi:hypothetical protein